MQDKNVDGTAGEKKIRGGLRRRILYIYFCNKIFPGDKFNLRVHFSILNSGDCRRVRKYFLRSILGTRTEAALAADLIGSQSGGRFGS